MMNAQITNIVEQAVLERMQARASFTALDVSNSLKAERYPVTHREVAAVVRDVFGSQAMGYYDYERKLISVVTEGGAKTTQAFLYHHAEVRAREYQTRDLTALPPVSPDQARDLADCAAASPLPILPGRVKSPRGSKPPKPSRVVRRRQDGALAIPRLLVEQLGWAVGDALALRCENGKMLVRPQSGPDDACLRVWGGQRVRVCKTKLRLGTLTAETVTVEMDGNGLRLETKGNSDGNMGIRKLR
ncbi:MAG: AbrB/MazE/SpoVT family DNA-binding domain-containing protein [Armatimonadota bacterium]|nr:AbrB/MazE/SpoVT family DNA-binding domain-containing protein [Armatimonadota bacterium]